MSPPAHAPLSEGGSEAHGFPWFAAGVGSWFGAWGMQSVLFSWLVVGELGASGQWVGVAQMTVLLPSLLLLLLGGAAADRLDPRRVLIRLHAVAALPVLALATVVAGDRLSIGALLVYGLCIGTVSAFVMPARDTLLSRVAGPDMMRAVTTMTIVQFAGQALGSLLAGGARWTGSAPMLLFQALVLLAGSLLTLRVPPSPPRPAATGSSPLREIREGLAVVASIPELRAMILLVAGVGLFFIGPFTVLIPLLVADFYQGSVADLSVVMVLFPIGAIAGSFVLRLRGGIRRKGLATLVALVGGAAALGTIGLGLPFAGMMAATFAWGLAGSVFINASRTLYQEAAPEDQRGRALSVYQLGFLGAAPLGSLSSGFLAEELGLLLTLRCASLAMLGLVALAALFTRTARME